MASIPPSRNPLPSASAPDVAFAQTSYGQTQQPNGELQADADAVQNRLQQYHETLSGAPRDTDGSWVAGAETAVAWATRQLHAAQTEYWQDKVSADLDWLEWAHQNAPDQLQQALDTYVSDLGALQVFMQDANAIQDAILPTDGQQLAAAVHVEAGAAQQGDGGTAASQVQSGTGTVFGLPSGFAGTQVYTSSAALSDGEATSLAASYAQADALATIDPAVSSYWKSKIGADQDWVEYEKGRLSPGQSTSESLEKAMETLRSDQGALYSVAHDKAVATANVRATVQWTDSAGQRREVTAAADGTAEVSRGEGNGSTAVYQAPVVLPVKPSSR